MMFLSEELAAKLIDIEVVTTDSLFPSQWRIGKPSGLQPSETINRVEVHRELFVPFTAVFAGFWKASKLVGSGRLTDALYFMFNGPLVPSLLFKKTFRDADIIHATPYPSPMALMSWSMSRRYRIPFVFTPFVHLELPSYKNEFLRHMLRHSEAVIAATEVERSTLAAIVGDRNKVHLLPMGIRIREWMKADGSSFRKRYALEGKDVVLFVGYKHYDKGAFHLLEAVSKLAESRNKISLVAIGEPTSEWINAKRKFYTTHERGMLIDLSWVSEKEKVDAYDACDVFAMPSRAEAFGMTYLEAWSRRKPVIAARTKATREVVRDGVDGLLVEFGDTNNLAVTIRALLDSEEMRRRLGEQGQIKVMNLHEWGKIAEKAREIYDSLLKRPLAAT